MEAKKNENENTDEKELQNLNIEGKQEEIKKDEEDNKGPIKLSRKVRFVLFIFIVSTELFMNNSRNRKSRRKSFVYLFQ